MTIAQQERTAVGPHGFELSVTSGFERYSVHHGELTLTSVFQPIFSLSHMRAVGYEGLLRAHDALDRPVSPLDVFGQAARLGEVLQVDRLAQALHLENFKVLGAEREWLFLNVHPGALTDPYHSAALLANLRRLDISPRRIVLEVLEQRAEDIERLADAVRQFRERGFLIALDDFGAGHSNVERIWQLNPDIVKLDRVMLSHAAHRADMAAILPGLVALLHEAGKLVLIEGVETEHEAQMALACNADFVQGFFFGRPNPGVADSVQAAQCIGELTDRHRIQTEARERQNAARLAPYVRAFERAAERLSAGEALDEVCWNFLALDHAARCFLLDANGRQSGSNVVLRADRAAHETRFLPLADAQGANWLRRPYFRAAIAAPERVHVTRPYLSINEAMPCVTLSVVTRIGGETCVLCGDIDWLDEERI
ncbi:MULTISPECIES: EAL domain-containing protein [Paraburkholderia]|uniref:EAL domain, c-di-GMP-specific phosphodiesterase class I (Or its enzymatically inactive variant) n=1 Tax=Paraburkholderia megapolitana TaxID=420953 RepID=A0A1I3FRY3_9BURK|nr:MULTISPECIES: EAL domain-containing protein [Paraburkholderia]MCX4163918.1 EAL domain-containing protein [Paraburkholderia megapolitana]MDN7159413.1 EAL domain-containing protein [Paraburkholderia sp. CHISQ3]MDQ6496460.1 EAL domain-containing protein [Paraburkholderia megapolitana]QDQ82520.1 EAL domain-containing protein [Paraburkholderia megapolitana]SFI13934.1 EAL domain, c-di-GMP-specific phosphodiesterase class I (or its enzymatically inactive variant) [Paraburkholderia megapolitana]